MSEAMSSGEIEDVLSSIRRLVSEEFRPAPRPAAVPRTEVKPTDKLILTPALRVVPLNDAAPADKALIDPRPTPLPRLHLGGESTTRVVVSTLERAVQAHSSDWESENGDPPLMVTDMEWTEDGWATPASKVVNFPPPPETPVAAWAQVDPDLVAPEATKTAPTIEPDHHWADLAEAEAIAELDVASADMPSSQTADTDIVENVDAEMTFDEAVLRELVRDLLLAELQGNLGERITRNIRKLVRAEIARALAIHDV